MNKHISILILAIALFFVPSRSQAGFLIKRKAPAAVSAATPAAAVHAEKKASRQERRQKLYNQVMDLIPHDGADCHAGKKCSRKGWQGTASMWIAIGCFFYFPPGLILALIFGATGMKPGYAHRNRAIAGVAISVAGIFFWHLLLTAMSWAV